MRLHYHTMLTIAGSDSIGGAGIQADIKTATSLGVYAMSAVTAVTAQNTSRVLAVDPVSPRMLRLQLEAVMADVRPDAVKIGMIPGEEHARAIAEFLERYTPENVVLDPVMAATAGTRFSSPEAIGIVKSRIIPAVTLVTPNIPEAEALSGLKISNMAEAAKVAQLLRKWSQCRAVLLKGGHLPENGCMTDLLATAGGIRRYTHSAVSTGNTHGTGCTLSSAIACYLALGHSLDAAVDSGISYLQEALSAGADMAFGRSSGYGPVNHLYKLSKQ